MEQRTGKRVRLDAYASGPVQPSDFIIEDYAIPAPGAGEFLVRNLFLSVDPMIRLFIDANPLGGPPFLPLGATIPGAAVGEVVKTHHPDYAVGDLLEGRFGWQHYALSSGAGVRRVSPALGAPENALGVGGLPGFTAFVGLEIAGDVGPGKTVLVSGAAGAVGSVVGPLVRARGGRAVGIAASAEKMRYLVEEAEYDVAVDRTAADFEAQLAQALPDGADLYFDNVGAPLFSSAIAHMASGGLILICGLMGQYEGAGGGQQYDALPFVLEKVMGKSLRIQSFTQLGQDALRPRFEAEIGDLLARGAIPANLHVREGIEQIPEAFRALFHQSVAGKVVVRIGERS